MPFGVGPDALVCVLLGRVFAQVWEAVLTPAQKTPCLGSILAPRRVLGLISLGFAGPKPSFVSWKWKEEAGSPEGQRPEAAARHRGSGRGAESGAEPEGSLSWKPAQGRLFLPAATPTLRPSL